MLNVNNCNESGKNTGFGDCTKDFKNIVGGFLVPSNFALTAEQTATPESVIAALSAAILAAPASRIYPIANFEAVTNNSTEPAAFTLGYGRPLTLNDGMYSWRLQFIDGGICLLKNLRKFNGTNRSVLLIDAEGALIGWKSGTSLKGVPLKNFYALPFVPNDYANPTGYFVDIAMLPTYLNDAPGWVNMDLASLVSLKGLQNIVLSEATGSALPALKIKAKTGCAETDLYDLYADELSSVPLWVATDADGAIITITSVVKDDALKAWTVTLDDSDPDYSVSGPIYLTLAPAAALAAQGIDGYEALTLTLP